MAIRSNANASCPKRSANAPSQTAYAMGGWFNAATIRASFQGSLAIYAGADGAPTTSDRYHAVGAPTSGSSTASLLYVDAGASKQVTLLTILPGFWYFFGLTCSGVAAGGLKAYGRAIFDRTMSVAVNTTTALTFTPARMEWGRDAFTGEYADCSMQHCFAFDRVVDEAEMMKLSYALLAEKPFPDRRGLNVYYRLRGAHDIVDLSGNQRAATMTVGANAAGPRVWPHWRNYPETAAAVSTFPPVPESLLLRAQLSTVLAR